MNVRRYSITRLRFTEPFYFTCNKSIAAAMYYVTMI